MMPLPLTRIAGGGKKKASDEYLRRSTPALFPLRKLFRQVDHMIECGGRTIRAKFVFVLMTLAMLCAPVFGQTTAEDWVEKGVDFFGQGKYDEAIKAFDKAIEINPQLAYAWSNKGLALSHGGKFNESIQAYDRAIEIDPKLADAWVNKGVALGLQGNHDGALQAFNNAIELNPQHANAWFGKAFTLQSLGRTTEADAAFARAEELGFTG